MTIMDKEDIKNSKKNKKNKKVKRKVNPILYKVLSFIFIILTVTTFTLLIYNGLFSLVELLTTIGISAIVVVLITLILCKSKLKQWIKNIISIFTLLIMVLEIFLIFFAPQTLKFISSLTDTGYRVETFGVYVIKDEYNSLSDLKDKSIDTLKYDDDKNINEVKSKIKKEIDFNTSEFDTISDLLNSLNKDKSDAIILETSYEDIIKEEYPDIYGRLKRIYTTDVVNMIKTLKSDKDITKEPFLVYISGIDTSGNVASSARSDVNIILAVNPNTKKIVMVNTPRDYYITLHTKNKKDKLTHAGIYGVEESLKTLSDLYDEQIDYYVRINFTSFVKIVDTLGGITVNVPGSFCEQDSKRSHANEICLSKGTQTLNGEQALALARNRHAFQEGDRARGEHQMLILESIINKALSPNIITKYSSILNALKGRVTTNMTGNEMINFAKKQIKDKSSYTFKSVSVTGKDSKGTCYSAGNATAYVMEPDKDTVDNAIKEINSLVSSE